MERLVEAQLTSVDSLSTKASVLLGFSLTTLGAMVGLGQGALQSHVPALALAASFLLVAGAIFARAYRIGSYRHPPDPSALLRLIDSSPRIFKGMLVASFAAAVTQNRRLIAERFRLLNRGLASFLMGTVIYTAGVGFA